ncbi:hypothetical protein DV702_15230 [Sporosarcina sp. PTS2304]|uniref:hypothetical protein n=1 Tax=Sporosarcina sp. PTS2304 TaxID=2283194 RepID=UPI000E0D9CE5|nr:hypothetical protein [Sporosarcina sp. PTS2304]AXI00943.1 hypothetical protein DV702_15230 [Sporosarcina sp. PTS2304]
MRITFHECKKALTSPVLIGLFVLFSVYNIFLITSQSHISDELKVANELSETYGLKITKASLRQLDHDIGLEMEQLRAMTGKSYEQVEWTDLDNFSEAELELYEQLQLKEMYADFAHTIDGEYAKIDLKMVAENEILKYGLSGQAAKVLRHEYGKLAQRFEELKQNDEHKEWFFLGKSYQMHSFLFRSLTAHLIFEILILVVLATAFMTNFEFENRTQLHTYASKRGRSLMKDKLAASLIIATLVTVLLMLVTFGTYFTVFDYTHLWGSSISSAFNWEYNFPYITWWEMPFLKFLMLVIGLIYMSMLLFTALAFAIAVVVKNSYATFFIIAILFTIGFLLPGFVPSNSILKDYAGYNLAALVVNPHMFFTGSNAVMFKHYEWMTVAVGTIIVVALCVQVMCYFRKQDIQ